MSTVNKIRGEKARIRKATRKTNQHIAALTTANKAIQSSMAPSELQSQSSAMLVASENLQLALAAYRATL